uniref:Uncharacterized protein n=1 Tax=mine drainage metagenome TaxID=410659 RepID=E6PP52_9ZZZZ
MIPALDDRTLLPPGVWDCTLVEVQDQFCWNAHRQHLWRLFLRFLAVEIVPMHLGCPLYIDGSFTRAKVLPDDIDVVVDLAGIDDVRALSLGLALRLRHDAIKTAYHVDVWARHPMLPHDFAAYFQYAGDKCAAELNLQPRDPKGILRVMRP